MVQITSVTLRTASRVCQRRDRVIVREVAHEGVDARRQRGRRRAAAALRTPATTSTSAVPRSAAHDLAPGPARRARDVHAPAPGRGPDRRSAGVGAEGGSRGP